MRWLLLLLTFTLAWLACSPTREDAAAPSRPIPSPESANAAAAQDVVKITPVASRRYIRYLSLYATPAKALESHGKVTDFWINSLSREAQLTKAHRVTPDLLRIDLRDYQIDPKVWDKLADSDPFFHARIEVERVDKIKKYWPGGKGPDGIDYTAGAYFETVKTRVKTTATAPWLNPADSKILVEHTQSRAPIVRADWFLVETSQQVDRNGTKTGYFDFLKVANRAEFQQLVGLDKALASKLQKEIRAIIARSGVALNNRQLVRFGTINGAYWASLDVVNNVARKNALKNLDQDFEGNHDAEELYGNLPNGLWAVFANNKDGGRQDNVPDNVASDKTWPGNDARIHPRNCFSCHLEGIRPIDDWARKTYRLPIVLADVDEDRLRRNRRLYLSDLEKWVKRDQADYAEVLGNLTGKKPAEMAVLFRRFHTNYSEADLSLADVARWTGYPESRVKTVLLAVATLTPPLDPVFADLLKPGGTIRVEHMEEGFAVLVTHLRGYLPSNAKVKESEK